MDWLNTMTVSYLYDSRDLQLIFIFRNTCYSQSNGQGRHYFPFLGSRARTRRAEEDGYAGGSSCNTSELDGLTQLPSRPSSSSRQCGPFPSISRSSNGHRSRIERFCTTRQRTFIRLGLSGRSILHARLHSTDASWSSELRLKSETRTTLTACHSDT